MDTGNAGNAGRLHLLQLVFLDQLVSLGHLSPETGPR